METCSGKKIILIGFSIISPLHLINFMTIYMRNKEAYEMAYVGLSSFLKTKNVPERYLDFCKKQGINFVEVHDIDTILSNNKKMKLDFVFINNYAFKAVLKSISSIRYIYFIDEGISTYRTKKSLITTNKAEKKNLIKVNKVDNNFICFIQYLIKFFLKILFEMIFLGRVKRLNFFNKNDYTVNAEFKSDFISILKKLPSEGRCLKENIVLYCSQPFLELNKVSEIDFIKSLTSIKTKVENKGYSLLIKKHPAEYMFDYENNGFEVLEFDGMLEEYIIKYPIVSLISKNSTSSLLANALINVPSYILDYNDSESLDENLKLLFSKYCLPFESF